VLVTTEQTRDGPLIDSPSLRSELATEIETDRDSQTLLSADFSVLLQRSVDDDRLQKTRIVRQPMGLRVEKGTGVSKLPLRHL
jgi:uncharacterized protein (DUF2235 family)